MNEQHNVAKVNLQKILSNRTDRFPVKKSQPHTTALKYSLQTATID
jgi:hypothetical protein